MTITLKVYKNSPEHGEYTNARFPKDRRHHSCSNETFEYEGNRWKYQVTSFDDNGDYDLLWRPDGKEPELMTSDATLRDYFAAKAMQGDWATERMDSGYWSQDDIDAIFKDKAETYYRMADAMLKARGDMEDKHSPAPWVAAEFLDGFNIKDEKYGRHIAFTPKQNNAHLIAAAPELLSELIRLRNIVASYKQDSGDNLDITDAVIAKALSQQ